MDRARDAARWCVEFAKDIGSEWSKDRVGGLAAEIAFFALLGFFPTMIVLAAALGSADAFVGESNASEVETWLVERMVEVFGGDNSLEETVRDLFAGSNPGAFTLGALLAVYAASRGFIAVVRALDIAYDHHETRGWLSTRLVGLGLTVVSVLAAAVAMMLIVVGPLFGNGTELAEDLGVGSGFATVWDWLRWPVAFAVLVGWAATVYHIAPNHHSPWRYELPGAVIGSIWWAVVSLGFSAYLDAASSGSNAVYGLLGGALSLLFWLYLMAMGLLLGAEINSIVAIRRGISLDQAPPSRVDQLLARGKEVPEVDDEA